MILRACRGTQGHLCRSHKAKHRARRERPGGRQRRQIVGNTVAVGVEVKIQIGKREATRENIAYRKIKTIRAIAGIGQRMLEVNGAAGGGIFCLRYRQRKRRDLLHLSLNSVGNGVEDGAGKRIGVDRARLIADKTTRQRRSMRNSR